ncbi:MAG: biotin synthase BioB, partial [Burkholderiaceae bacterium]
MSSQVVTFHSPRAASAAAPADAAWTVEQVAALFALPFPELLHRAQTVHREHFDPAEVELATLLSIKTGGCPEDCGYCPQAARYDT